MFWVTWVLMLMFLCAALFVAAFTSFPIPELLPRHYWLFHSLWHAFLGAGNVYMPHRLWILVC